MSALLPQTTYQQQKYIISGHGGYPNIKTEDTGSSFFNLSAMLRLSAILFNDGTFPVPGLWNVRVDKIKVPMFLALS
jgi:hypothetical protein